MTLVMPPRKVDTSLKFATSESSHLVLRWEMFRPRYGNTVEIITGAQQAMGQSRETLASHGCHGHGPTVLRLADHHSTIFAQRHAGPGTH